MDQDRESISSDLFIESHLEMLAEEIGLSLEGEDSLIEKFAALHNTTGLTQITLNYGIYRYFEAEGDMDKGSLGKWRQHKLLNIYLADVLEGIRATLDLSIDQFAREELDIDPEVYTKLCMAKAVPRIETTQKLVDYAKAKDEELAEKAEAND